MLSSLQEFRRRQAARGFKRLEIAVRAEDAALIRFVASALAEGGNAADELRQAVEKNVPVKPTISYKEWLTASSDE